MSSLRVALVLTAFAGTIGAVACGAQNFSESASAPDASTTDASSGDSASTSDVGSGAALPRSCKQVSGADGIYMIDPIRDSGAPLSVYCDMTTAGGGWTLVGRSAKLDPADFGWTTDKGTPDSSPNDSYSLDVARAHLVFSTVLLGSRVSGGPWKDAFRIDGIPSDFLTKHANGTSLLAVTSVTQVGSCMPANGPQMLTHVGFTSSKLGFFFRDIADVSMFKGLGPTGWNLTYDDCPKGGNLDGAQGMIFVR